MADYTSARSRTGLALILALLVVFAAACKSTSDSASSDSGSGGGSSVVASSAPIASSSGQAQKICGSPPCVRFVSRGDTKTLSSTIAEHPVLSTVALHAAVTVLCGGILCLLGEGVSLDYVGHAAKDAAGQHACLMVSILPDSSKWKLVSLSASNQSPYCKD